MPLPLPNLDDRRFQDLVDDARRLVQRRCPEWTDHNVSDPGITLIETFAYLVDQVLYRLNRVPERSYVTFLELMGVELFATVGGTRAGHVLADRADGRGPRRRGRRRGRHPPPPHAPSRSIFRTIDELVDRQLPAHLRDDRRRRRAAVRPDERARQRATGRRLLVATATSTTCCTSGSSRAVPNCAVAVHVDCDAEGHGIDPTDPPWVWEALGADGWARCDVEDRTGGFNQPGDVIVHVPGSHTETVLEERSAGWLRCRIVGAGRRDADRLHRLAAAARRSTATRSAARSMAVHGEDVVDEVIGVSEGVPGQRFALLRRPVVAAERPVQLEVAGPSGWEAWAQVQSFGESAADEQHWRLNANEGTVVFGPAVRMEDGSLRNYGADPAGRRPHPRAPLPHRRRPGAATSAPTRSSRCARRSRSSARSTTGARPIGGVDGESVEAAKTRGPARARHAQPRRHRPRLRAAGPRGDARGRPRALPARRRGRPDRRATPARAAGVRVMIVPAVADRRVGPDDVRAARAVGADDGDGQRVPRGAADGRRTGGRHAAALPRRHRRDPAAGPAARRSRRGAGGARSTPCSATSTRSAAGPTATAGRSGARSCSARCSASPSGSTASTSSRTPACSRPTRSPASAARPSPASTSTPTRSCSRTATRCRC